MSEFFGWDLLFKSIERDVGSETDIVIAFVHWFLIKKSSFRCLGIGEDKTLDENEEGSELLPDGWNAKRDCYALRYVFNDTLYNLLAAKSGETLIINLLDIKTRNCSNFAICPKNAIKSLSGKIKTVMPTASQVVGRLQKELLEPVFKGNTKEITTQTHDPCHRNSFPNRDARPLNPDPLMIPSRPRGGFDPLRDVGRGDLDPLGRGGSGMIFSPPPGNPFGIRNPSGGSSFPGPGNFPGARFPPPPPGARFDPFGPPEAGTAIPNPDHFRPPPDFDDMYT